MRRIWLLIAFLCLALVSRAEVPIYAYVVCGTNGTQMAASPATVSEYVNELTGKYDTVWDLFNVEIGFWEHGTRTPTCE